MTVLVTGGAGYIGSHMVHALVDAGERVVVLDNLATGFDWAVAQDASLVIGDVGDQPRVAALIAEHRVDAVVHFAASVVVPDSVRDPLSYYRHSAGATTRERCFSTPLTSTAMTAVAKTKPSAMVAVVPSTRSKPPRPYRSAIAVTAAPAARKVRK